MTFHTIHLIHRALLGFDQRSQFRQRHLTDGEQIALSLQHTGKLRNVGLQPVLFLIALGGHAKVVDHCIDVGCEIEAGKCISCVHAEVNAILGCGPNIAGGTVYCTLRPCLACTQLLINARVSKVVYIEIRHKTNPYFEKVVKQSGIVMVKFGGLK